MKSFIDLANVVKELMDENQQPSIQAELERLFPCTIAGRGEVKAESSIGLMQVNYLLLQQLIQILVLQHRLAKNGRNMEIKNLWGLPVNLQFSPCKTH